MACAGIANMMNAIVLDTRQQRQRSKASAR
jgi:hypothetical protein